MPTIKRSAFSTAEIPTKASRWRSGVVAILAVLAGLIAVHEGSRRYQVAQYAAAAKAAHEAKNWGRLNFAARQWLAQFPHAPQALLYAAQAADEQGDFDVAAEYLQRIPDSALLADVALQRLVVLYIGPLNRPDLVEPTLIRLKEVAGAPLVADRELLRYYGMTAQREKETRYAREVIVESNATLRAAYIYLMEVDAVLFGHGEEICAHWLESDINPELYRVALLVNHARSIGLSEAADQLVENEQREKELALQEKELRKCFANFPNNIELLSLLISTSIDRGDVERVAELLGGVPSSAGDDPRFYRYKGWVHRMRDEYPLAEAAFGKAIAIDCYDWRSRHQLAEVLRLSNQPEKAAESLTLAAMGSAVRKSILKLDNLENIPDDLMEQMRAYAEAVGDEVVARRLQDTVLP